MSVMQSKIVFYTGENFKGVIEIHKILELPEFCEFQ